MRYVHTNDDGTIGIWATIPTRIVRDDGAVFIVHGNNIGMRGKSVLLGRWLTGAGSEEVIIGAEGFDPADLEAGSLPGHTIEFPDFEKDIKARLHRDAAAKIVSHRTCKASEIPTDRARRSEWRDTGSKIEVRAERLVK